MIKTFVARVVDLDTKDYVVDGRQFQETTSVKQRIVIALSSTQGSGAAVRELGFALPPGTVMGKGFDATAKDAVRRSLKQIVEVEKKAKIVDLIVSRMGNTAFITLSFIDLTDPANKPEFLKIPVRIP